MPGASPAPAWVAWRPPDPSLGPALRPTRHRGRVRGLAALGWGSKGPWPSCPEHTREGESAGSGPADKTRPRGQEDTRAGVCSRKTPARTCLFTKVKAPQTAASFRRSAQRTAPPGPLRLPPSLPSPTPRGPGPWPSPVLAVLGWVLSTLVFPVASGGAGALQGRLAPLREAQNAGVWGVRGPQSPGTELALDPQSSSALSPPGGSVVRNPPAVQETRVPSLGGGAPLEEGMAPLLQCSCLGKPMDRGAWRATAAHGVAESDTTDRLSSSSNPLSHALRADSGSRLAPVFVAAPGAQSGNACAAQESKFSKQWKTLTSLM